MTTALNINAVRQHLLDTLADLRNPDSPMDIDRAQAVAGVAKVLVESAKVEVDFVRATGQAGSGFIPDADALEQPKPGPSAQQALKHEREPRASAAPGSPFAVLDRPRKP